jgi:sulfur-oxidizing protein SoxY
MLSMKRRIFLQGTVAGSLIGIAASTGLLAPRTILAATWPKQAFEAKSVSDAINALYGAEAPTESADIDIKAPAIAENGAVVPITIETTLPDVESISLVAKENPVPLTSTYVLAQNAQPYVATRIKMGKTSDVVALVKSGGKLYSASKEIKVTIGGCGG